MARGKKSRVRKGGKPRTARSSPSAASPPPVPSLAAPVAVLKDDHLHPIFLRLDPADLLRAALACRRWRRVAAGVAGAVPRAPPLLGYFFHPSVNLPPPFPPKTDIMHRPAVFAPLDLYSPRLSLRLAPGAASGLSIRDVHLGLVLLLPVARGRPVTSLPRVLVVDPASRRRELLPPPPRTALRGDAWRDDRRVLGVAVLSRSHPSRLTFEAVCVTLDGDRPRAWVANVRDGACTWLVLPRAKNVKVDFDADDFDGSCVRAAGNIYWHIDGSDRLLALDPATLKFSFLLAPDDIGSHYRVGEKPEDGQLCIVAAAGHEEVQIWVRAKEDDECNDNGWVLEREVCMREALDTVPRLPKGKQRMALTWVTDMDYARTGKVFIMTWGFGRYAFHLETGQLENLETHDRLVRGDPIWAYTLAWPPAFLAPQDPL
ncbi:hypothetical protein EJB05_44590, partial [Eragrostis curvula]